MARIRAIDGRVPCPVEGHWQLVTTPPGAYAGPGDLDALEGWIPAPVPGTAAAALRASGLWSEAEPAPLHDRDVWYRAPLSGRGRERLRFEGLATLAEVWLDGVPVLVGDSMFLTYEVEVDLNPGSTLAICFRSLSNELARPYKRGRWRPRLATPGSLRHARTSLLGFMPGWCPPVDIVGPYRPITRAPAAPVSVDLRATLDGATGRLAARLHCEGGGTPVLRCGDREVRLRETAPGVFAGELALPGVATWWPHTHGEPRLHAVEAVVGGRHLDLGRVGFRTISLTRPFEEGLGLAVNGVPVFCRGACWTPADLVEVPATAEGCRPLLALAQEAGMNMLRVPGVTLYEADAFHDLCDEMGILVWQDLMLANFDYPTDDPAFRDRLGREVTGFLDRTQTAPSLCVVCGGSEMQQQAAMLGLPREAYAGGFAAETLPALVSAARSDAIVVPNSPSGGDLPFSTGAGVTHYYGVGAYRRPLTDARRAEVGFASECLAFANVPEPETLGRAGLTDPTSESWRAAIPRDRGADWDFEGVRDHYVASLFGLDPAALRSADPERYLTLGRAAVAEVMEAVFAEWRRARSVTAGGLVWFLRDLAPGAGWGVIDAHGCPKSAWYALKRAFRPVQVSLSDEGLNGLNVHAHNETASAIDASLRLAFTDTAGRPVAAADRAVRLAPRNSSVWSSAELLGRFFDATHVYRFGPPAHSLAHASLSDASGSPLAEAFHVPAGYDPEPRAIGLRADLTRDADGWAIRVAAERHALGVHIAVEGARPADNWFHLAPGRARRLPLIGTVASPRGTVRAVNGSEIVRFGDDARIDMTGEP